MNEKIMVFEEWFNSHEFNHLKTGSHKERCEIAWNARNLEIDSLKTQLKEKDEQVEKLQAIIDDVDDPYCFTTYCSGLIKEHDDEVKQKDAEIEKKDELLKEAIEILNNCLCMTPLNAFERGDLIKDFLNKMEAGK